MDDQVMAIVAIEQVLNRYPRAVDDRDWAVFEAIFHPDVVCDMTAMGLGVTRDRDELVACFDRIDHPVAHHLVNPVVEFLDEDRARVTSTWWVVLADRTTLSGTYHDEVARTDGRWSVRCRRITARQANSRRPVGGYDLDASGPTTGGG